MHVRTLLAALFGPLLALLLCELGARSGWADRQVLRTAPGSPEHARALLRTRPDARVGIIGSSVALIDVQPELLASRLGRPVVDAGVLAAPLVSTWMLGPDLWATDIEEFILVVAASDLTVDVPVHRLRHVDIAEALDLFGGPFLLRYRDRALDWSVGSSSVAWRRRHLLRESLAVEPRVHPRDKERDGASDARALGLREKQADLRWTRDSANVEALRRLARSLQAADRTLIVVPAPQDPRITGDAVRPELLDLLYGLSREEPLELLVPTGWPVWRPEHFRDGVHLAPSGQVAFTSGLASALERRR